MAHSVAGRLRLKLEPPHSTVRLLLAHRALASVAGVRAVDVKASAWSLIVEYDPTLLTPAALLALPVPDGPPPPTGSTGATYPYHVEVTALVAAPRARAWRILTEPEQLASHVPGTVRVLDTTDSNRWVAEVEVLGKRLTQHIQIVERDMEHRLVLLLSGQLRARLTITLVSCGANTRLHERLDYTLPGRVLGWLIDRAAAGDRLRAELAEHVQRLAAAVGDGSTATPENSAPPGVTS